MSKMNPYQPPADELPGHIKLKQQADVRTRLSATKPIPDIDFWLATVGGVLVLILADAVHNKFAMAVLIAWLTGCLRVCMVYSSRARAALPPLNAIWLLVTSTVFCFTLQTVILAIWFAAFFIFRVPSGPVAVVVALSPILLYMIFFAWSIRWENNE